MIEYKLKQVCEQNGVAATVNTLKEAFAEKKITAGDFSLRRMAEAFIGHQWQSVLELSLIHI